MIRKNDLVFPCLTAPDDSRDYSRDYWEEPRKNIYGIVDDCKRIAASNGGFIMGGPGRVFKATYRYGYPGVNYRNIRCQMILGDQELIIVQLKTFGQQELFRIGYRWIESVSGTVDSVWRNPLVTSQSLLFSRKKVKQVILMVKGKDRDGNTVIFPVVFTPDNPYSQIDSWLYQEIAKSRGVVSK